jgi:hypothetical protein
MELLKGLGAVALAIGAMAAMLLIATLFFSGVAYVSAIVIPWLFDAAWIAFGISLFILLPLSFFKATCVFSSFGFMISSYAFGICGWAFGFLVTYTLWGFWGLAVGLLIAGIGVVPVGILAAAIHGTWNVVWELLILIALTFGTRIYALYLANRADQDTYERNTITLEAK